MTHQSAIRTFRASVAGLALSALILLALVTAWLTAGCGKAAGLRRGSASGFPRDSIDNAPPSGVRRLDAALSRRRLDAAGIPPSSPDLLAAGGFPLLAPHAGSALAGTDFYHHDAFGSTVNLAGPDGTVRQAYLYDAWGNARQTQAGGLCVDAPDLGIDGLADGDAYLGRLAQLPDLLFLTIDKSIGCDLAKAHFGTTDFIRGFLRGSAVRRWP